eukprot:g6538.t1
MGTVAPLTDSKTPSQDVADGDAPDGSDYANYFCTYAFLYHQKDMLEDHKRTGAYYDAVMQNKNLFKDSVVLDVGTGTGILSLFAALAGAAKVYAVEATSMAVHARTLMKANKVEDRVVVVEGMMENIEIPEKVDIIISEWMGYFLLRESMLDSVLIARDKYLKPGGCLFPSHANMYLVPIRSQLPYQRQAEYQGVMSGWHAFVNEMYSYYRVDLHCLSQDFEKEQRDYYQCTAQWSEVFPNQILASPICFKSYDLLKVTLDEIKAPLKAKMEFQLQQYGSIDALCGFFDVTFAGSPENPVEVPVRLTTAPDPVKCTHWGQLSFSLIPSLKCSPQTTLPLSVTLVRRKDNHRLMNMVVEFQGDEGSPYSGKYSFFIE